MPKSSPSDVAAILEQLKRTSVDFHSYDEFEKMLLSGKQLRIKYGVDLTAPFLHIGHAVNLWMMRQLQDAGHKVVFMLGDFTTRIGDPTGRAQTRPVLTDEAIRANKDAIADMVSRVLLTDPEVFEERWNSEWYSKMSVAEFIALTGMATHGHLISRDMFQARIAEGHPIHMHEMLYPIAQGYDSYALDSDVTIVGTDQLFNELMGRFYQERLGQRPQVVITTRITPGTDGKEKQSKSIGNFVALTDTPADKFGKTMSIPDRIMRDWFEVYTTLPYDKIDELMSRHPRDAKLELAFRVVERYDGIDAAEREKAAFIEVFSKKQLPDEMPDLMVSGESSVLDLVASARPDLSRSRVRDLITQGAVSIDETVLKDPLAAVTPVDGSVLKAGKRNWYRLQVTK